MGGAWDILCDPPPSGDSAQPYDFRALAGICVYRHIGTDPWLERHLMFNTVSHRWLYREVLQGL